MIRHSAVQPPRVLPLPERRLPAAAGRRHRQDVAARSPVGQYRTYVHIPPDEEFTYDTWCRNLALGRTFLSGGPLLEFSVDGAQIGDTLHLPAAAARSRSRPRATFRYCRSTRCRSSRTAQVVAQTDEPRRCARADAARRVAGRRPQLAVRARVWPELRAARRITTSGRAASSRTRRRSTSPAATSGRWPTRPACSTC